MTVRERLAEIRRLLLLSMGDAELVTLIRNRVHFTRLLDQLTLLEKEWEDEQQAYAAALHDLREEAEGRRPVSWRPITAADVLRVLAEAEGPVGLQDILIALLRKGLYPEDDTDYVHLCIRGLCEGGHPITYVDGQCVLAKDPVNKAVAH